ncbi:MAG: 4Fe-4S binding protein [Verrucomicrobiae bacterium]|nr:4Fe-4S binding protein [Verrucomicrobiae bacterium]
MALAWPFGPQAWAAVPLPSLSFYVAICSAVAARLAGFVTMLGLPVVLLALLVPRGFCRYACPTGLLLEFAAKLRPSAPSRWLSWPMIGRWCALLTLGGALAGYPVFLWLDPLAIFNGFFSAWRQPMTVAAVCAAAALPLLLILELIVPRAWCARLCPLGATQELLALRGPTAGQPGPRSPRHPLLPMMDKGMTLIQCASQPEVSRGVLARRGFIALCVGAAGGLAVRATGGSSPALRPPGAVDEARFTGVCVRCGSCMRVCPTRILQPDLGGHGLASLLTPVARFDDGYCREDCHRCNQVCPTGAIARLSLAEKRRRVIGPAKVDLDVCLLANGQECTACIRACPYQALTVVSDGFESQPRLDLTRCTGCGACEAICPTRPARAIRVVPGAGELSKTGTVCKAS